LRPAVTKELLEEWIIHERILLRLSHLQLRVNRNYCRRDLAHHIGVRNPRAAGRSIRGRVIDRSIVYGRIIG
jgi:hypothetical protein